MIQPGTPATTIKKVMAIESSQARRFIMIAFRQLVALRSSVRSLPSIAPMSALIAVLTIVARDSSKIEAAKIDNLLSAAPPESGYLRCDRTSLSRTIHNAPLSHSFSNGLLVQRIGE